MGNLLLQVVPASAADRAQLMQSLLAHAVEVNPRSARAHNELGGALLQAGKPVDAVRHFRDATQLSPDDPYLQFNLGKALAAAGSVGCRARVSTRADTECPTSPMRTMNWACCCLRRAASTRPSYICGKRSTWRLDQRWRTAISAARSRRPGSATRPCSTFDARSRSILATRPRRKIWRGSHGPAALKQPVSAQPTTWRVFESGIVAHVVEARIHGEE
jgi:hypothetical protein